MSEYTYNEYTKLIEDALFSYLKVESKSLGEEKMHEAMLYSVENGGKRIRPMLVLEFCRICVGGAGHGTLLSGELANIVMRSDDIRR